MRWRWDKKQAENLTIEINENSIVLDEKNESGEETQVV